MPTPYSYSSLSLFETCPHAYAHTYIWKTEVPEAPLDLPMACGNIVHSILEQTHLKQLEKKPIEWSTIENQLPELWKKILIESPVPIPEEELIPFVKKSHETVRWYFDTIFGREEEATIGVEQKILYPLNPKRRQWIIGFLDRVSQPHETRIIIHDYKTGSKKLNEKNLSQDYQASLYGAMAAHQYFPLSEIELRWHYLAHQKTVKAKLDPKDARNAIQKSHLISTQIEDHKKIGLFSPKPGWHCNRCAFFSLCPAQKENQK